MRMVALGPALIALCAGCATAPSQQRPGTGPPPPADVREEALGWTKPRKSCPSDFGSRIPLGPELPDQMTVKFAILADGTPSAFQVLTPGVSPRLADAVWDAIRQCHWAPGANPDGNPTAIWVLMPFRFYR
jgi:hypothetical protein